MSCQWPKECQYFEPPKFECIPIHLSMPMQNSPVNRSIAVSTTAAQRSTDRRCKSVQYFRVLPPKFVLPTSNTFEGNSHRLVRNYVECTHSISIQILRCLDLNERQLNTTDTIVNSPKSTSIKIKRLNNFIFSTTSRLLTYLCIHFIRIGKCGTTVHMTLC